LISCERSAKLRFAGYQAELEPAPRGYIDLPGLPASFSITANAGQHGNHEVPGFR